MRCRCRPSNGVARQASLGRVPRALQLRTRGWVDRALDQPFTYTFECWHTYKRAADSRVALLGSGSANIYGSAQADDGGTAI